MAGRQMKHASYRLFAATTVGETARVAPMVDSDEFDEFDVWGGSGPTELLLQPPAEFGKPIPPARASRRSKAGSDRAAAAAASLPVNIPDWSKILRHEYRDHYNGSHDDGGYYGGERWAEEEEEAELGAGGVMIPPHELLWKSRGASFSVHEGIGRTLKGRDLRRVRNAIFEKTGFQD